MHIIKKISGPQRSVVLSLKKKKKVTFVSSESQKLRKLGQVFIQRMVKKF